MSPGLSASLTAAPENSCPMHVCKVPESLPSENISSNRSSATRASMALPRMRPRFVVGFVSMSLKRRSKAPRLRSRKLPLVHP